MNKMPTVSAPLSSAEKLALAQQAFEQHHSRCFWFMREDLKVANKDLPTIISGLRQHGNRSAFLIASILCR